MAYCNIRLTTVIPNQQVAPKINGLPPVFTSLTTSVFNPIAAIAITMKNLLRVFKGSKTDAEYPKEDTTVVMTDANTKNKIKKGKILFKEIFVSDFSFFCPDKGQYQGNGDNSQGSCQFYGNGFIQSLRT